MKKIIISESQYAKHKDVINEMCSSDIDEGKRATINVANQVRNTTNRKEDHLNDTFDDHEKQKMSLANFLRVPSNVERLNRGMDIIDHEGNIGKLQGVNRLKKGFTIDYLDMDGQPMTKNAMSVYILV